MLKERESECVRLLVNQLRNELKDLAGSAIDINDKPLTSEQQQVGHRVYVCI